MRKKAKLCRHGHPADRAWEPEAEVAKGPRLKGPLGHHFPQGTIFSSHDITAQCQSDAYVAQCTVCAPFLVAGGWGTKEKKHFRAMGEIWVWLQCQLGGKDSSLTLVN